MKKSDTWINIVSKRMERVACYQTISIHPRWKLRGHLWFLIDRINCPKNWNINRTFSFRTEMYKEYLQINHLVFSGNEDQSRNPISSSTIIIKFKVALHVNVQWTNEKMFGLFAIARRTKKTKEHERHNEESIKQ